jgi:hypothetical protein
MEMAMELKRLVTLTFDKNVGTGDRIFRRPEQSYRALLRQVRKASVNPCNS